MHSTERDAPRRVPLCAFPVRATHSFGGDPNRNAQSHLETTRHRELSSFSGDPNRSAQFHLRTMSHRATRSSSGDPKESPLRPVPHDDITSCRHGRTPPTEVAPSCRQFAIMLEVTRVIAGRD